MVGWLPDFLVFLAFLVGWFTGFPCFPCWLVSWFSRSIGFLLSKVSQDSWFPWFCLLAGLLVFLALPVVCLHPLPRRLLKPCPNKFVQTLPKHLLETTGELVIAAHHFVYGAPAVWFTCVPAGFDSNNRAITLDDGNAHQLLAKHTQNARAGGLKPVFDHTFRDQFWSWICAHKSDRKFGATPIATIMGANSMTPTKAKSMTRFCCLETDVN